MIKYQQDIPVGLYFITPTRLLGATVLFGLKTIKNHSSPNHTSAIRRGPTPCVSAPKRAAGQDGLVGFPRCFWGGLCKEISSVILQDTHNGTGVFTYKTVIQGIYYVVNPPAPIDCLSIYYQTQTNGFKSGIYLGFLQIR